MNQRKRPSLPPAPGPAAANDNWPVSPQQMRRYIGPHSSYRVFRKGVLQRIWLRLVMLLSFRSA